MRKVVTGQEFGVTGSYGRDGGATFQVPFFMNELSEMSSVVPLTWEGLAWTGEARVSETPSGPRWKVVATYQGIVPTLAPGAGTLGGANPGEWEIEPADEEVPIEKHPYLQELMNDFGGYIENGKVRFPEKLGVFTPSKTGLFGNPDTPTRGGLAGAKYRTGDPNPAFGFETFFQPGCRVRLTRVLASVPSSMMRDANRVIKQLPIEALRGVDWQGHEWLTLRPIPSSFGTAVRYVEQWLMSGPNGWDPVQVALAYGGRR